jgi:hypothetical protein
MKQLSPTFWVTNISNKNVTLTDLYISIKANSSVNLLSKHYSFTLEQLEKSHASGSIYTKRDKIVKRKVPPPPPEETVLKIDVNSIVPSKPRSIFEIKHQRYVELEISDEEYQAQTGELDDQ